MGIVCKLHSQLNGRQDQTERKREGEAHQNTAEGRAHRHVLLLQTPGPPVSQRLKEKRGEESESDVCYDTEKRGHKGDDYYSIAILWVLISYIFRYLSMTPCHWHPVIRAKLYSIEG